jgi:hypothetical protein
VLIDAEVQKQRFRCRGVAVERGVVVVEVQRCIVRCIAGAVVGVKRGCRGVQSVLVQI